MGSLRDEAVECAQLEYQILMSEAGTRIDIRHQVVLSTLAFAAGFAGFGLDQPYLAFLYPLFALFLVAGWWHNEIRIRQIGVYTRDHLSPVLGQLRWDTYLKDRKASTQIGGVPVVVAAPAGVFLTTEVLALSIGVASSPSGPLTYVAVAFALFVLGVTIWMIWRVSAETRRR